jgi:hypothetical protein
MGDQAKINRIIGGIVVAFAALLAYSNSFTNDFVWDDASSVLIHQDVQNPANVLELFKKDQHAFGRGQGNFYRPLVSLSFMIDYALAGGQARFVSPFIFHITNVAWHAFAAVMLLILLIRMGAVLPVAGAVATVYAVHPVHTEAVTYISGRADSMAAALLFTSLVFALTKASGQVRIIAVGASAIAFAAAILCKESALIYTPLLILCACATPTGDGAERIGARLRSRALPIGAGVAITAAYAVLRSTVLSFGSDSSPRGLSFAEHMGEVFGAFALYIKLIVWPTGLHMERVLVDQPLWQVFAGMFLIIGICAGIVIAARAGRERIAAGLGWFVITWLPISGLFPLNAPMAEHWLYVPIAGLLWAAAELLWPMVNRDKVRPIAAVVLAAAIFTLIAVSVDRNRDWRDNQTIYAATLDQNPNTIRVNYNLAVTYEDIVDNAPGAQRHFKRVLTLYNEKRAAEGTPEDAFWADEFDSQLSLGRLYLDDARYDLAFGQFIPLVQSASKANAGDVAARAAMGLVICYIATSQTPQAVDLLTRLGQTDQFPSASAYYRRIFAGNRRIASQMQEMLMRASTMQQQQPAGAQPITTPQAAPARPAA